MAENNQTNIEKADEIAGYFSYAGEIPGPQYLYVTFLASTPAALTSMGVLVDKINDGTAERHDYVHAMTSLGQAGVGVVGLMVLGGVVSTAALPVLVGIGFGLAALDYVDGLDYNPQSIIDDLISKANQLGELLGDALKSIPDGEDVEDFLSDLGGALNGLIDAIGDAVVDTINPQDILGGILDGLQAALPGGLLPWLFDLIPNDMNPLINVPWKEAMYLDFWISPLVLDLDGDGVETFGITSDKQVLFDHDGDGVRNGTGWVKSDDGLLAA